MPAKKTSRKAAKKTSKRSRRTAAGRSGRGPNTGPARPRSRGTGTTARKHAPADAVECRVPRGRYPHEKAAVEYAHRRYGVNPAKASVKATKTDWIIKG